MLIISVINFQVFGKYFHPSSQKICFSLLETNFLVCFFVKCQGIERACVFIYSFIRIADKVMGIYFPELSYPEGDEIRGAGHVLHYYYES